MKSGTDDNLKEGGEELRYDLIAEMPNCPVLMTRTSMHYCGESIPCTGAVIGPFDLVGAGEGADALACTVRNILR